MEQGKQDNRIEHQPGGDGGNRTSGSRSTGTSMSIVEKNACVTMVRGDLGNIPVYPVPAGYSIRTYSPGDEHTWVLIQSAAEPYEKITLELFRSEFGDEPTTLAQRQFFLTDPEAQAIGTATAWFDEDHNGQPCGRVHWVAVHPRSQGRGLSKPLLSKACSTLNELGHDRAYLITSTARVAAIRLYLQFGFVPEIEGPEGATVWAEMKRYLAGLAEH